MGGGVLQAGRGDGGSGVVNDVIWMMRRLTRKRSWKTVGRGRCRLVADLIIGGRFAFPMIQAWL